MTPEQVAAAGRPWCWSWAARSASARPTLRRARLLGLSGWAFYVTGRGGALGDVRAETVAAALGFIAPDAVADGWDAAPGSSRRRGGRRQPRRVLPVGSQQLAACPARAAGRADRAGGARRRRRRDAALRRLAGDAAAGPPPGAAPPGCDCCASTSPAPTCWRCGPPA